MKDIRFGICALPDQIAQAAAAGYDYIEIDINRILAMDESHYRDMARQMEKCGVYAEVLCGMLPEGMPIVGDHVNANDLHHALARSFETARALGASIVVFDSPASRRLPAKADPALAWRQLGNFIRMVQSYAGGTGVAAALMPLRRAEADLLNHTSEAAMIPAILQLDHVGVAASSFHMAMEAESPATLARMGSLLYHVRMSAAPSGRLPSAADGEGYRRMFEALCAMGFAGRVSCEGSCRDFITDAQAALHVLRGAWVAAGTMARR